MTFEWKQKTFRGLEDYDKTVFQQAKDKDSEPADDAFTIEASPVGIRMYGRMLGHLENKADLDSYAKAIGAAFIEFSRLRNQKVKKLKGRPRLVT